MSNPAIVPKEVNLGKSLFDRSFVPLLIIFSSLLSFGVGRYMAITEETEPVTIEELSFSTTTDNTQKGTQAVKGEGTVIASKNGTKYHLPDCPGAGQIKEENKVWFESAAAAVAAGYTPAANCPGLK